MNENRAADAALDTFPKLLRDMAARRGTRPAMREKSLGIWQTWNWREVADNVATLASGLAAMGLKRGDKVAIIGDNRPQLYWAVAASQSLGAVAVPIYQDSVATEMQYVLEHAEARFVFAENQEQVDKLLAIKDQIPRVECIIYKDPRGLRHYAQAFLHPFEQVQAKGRAFAAANPDFLDGEVAKGRGGDVSVICYTSGTTGRPKGVMLSYGNLIFGARGAMDFEHLDENHELLSYLPMAWVGDHFFSYAQALVTGFTINCPESADTVLIDLKDVGPTYFFAPPRIFENILTSVMIRMEDASAIKRRLFAYFMDLARRVGIPLLEGRAVGLLDRLLYALGEVLVYGPLKNVLGFSRVRLAYTAGEAIGPDIFDFFRSLGVNLKQLYGQTESSVYLCIQPDNQVRSDTVGPPAPGVEIKVNADGEVIYRSPAVFVGYYKNDEATAATKTADGWVRTGDAGVFTQEGHVRIIDRAKDVGRLADGTIFAPKYLENKLKFFPYVKEAVCFGDGREQVTALINIDLGAVGNWAERRGLAFASYADLAGRPEVYDLVGGCVEKVNRDLSADAGLAGSQIRRFLILHKELDADDGELTRTRKVRRSTVAERYGALIDGLNSGRDHVPVEARVTFEDGRTGVVRADVKIRQARTFAHMRQSA
jgi:long-chain acyl-CoA synthetase